MMAFAIMFSPVGAATVNAAEALEKEGTATLFRLAIVAIALWLRAGMDPARLTAKVLLMVLVLDLGSIPFIWVSLKNRLKEIQGGEEDAAAQY